jgi:hypothetical protein
MSLLRPLGSPRDLDEEVGAPGFGVRMDSPATIFPASPAIDRDLHRHRAIDAVKALIHWVEENGRDLQVVDPQRDKQLITVCRARAKFASS